MVTGGMWRRKIKTEIKNGDIVIYDETIKNYNSYPVEVNLVYKNKSNI